MGVNKGVRVSVVEVSQDVNPESFRQGAPWRITTDLNEACNITCSYCHIDALFGPNARDSRTLPIDTFGQLAQDADALRVFDLTLTGGEITGMRDFDQYLDRIRNLGFTSTQIITNGTLLRRRLVGKLVDAGVSRVSISVDGLETANDAARGKGVWRRAWKGIESAVEGGLPVNVISVLGKHNLQGWEQLPPLLKAAGVRSQNLSLMCRLGRAESADEWMGVPEGELDDLWRKARALQGELNDNTFSLFFNDGVLRQPGWSGEPTPLHAFQDRNPGIEAVVRVDGTVLRNRLYGRDRAIGSIATASFGELWARDAERRQQLASVVGGANVGNLPGLYHHYRSGEDDGNSPQPVYSATIPTVSSKLRVREEAWGTITFDPQTFTITNIIAKGSARV